VFPIDVIAHSNQQRVSHRDQEDGYQPLLMHLCTRRALDERTEVDLEREMHSAGLLKVFRRQQLTQPQLPFVQDYRLAAYVQRG
jgi:hypothetical protein